MKILIVLFVSLSIILFSCKKWGTKKTFVFGNVVNLGENSPGSNIIIELSYKFFSGDDYVIEEIISDENGDFSFEFDAEKDEDYKISARYIDYKQVSEESSDYPQIRNSSKVIVGAKNYLSLSAAENIELKLSILKDGGTLDLLDSIKIRHYHQHIKPKNSNSVILWKTYIPLYNFYQLSYDEVIFAGNNIFEYIEYQNGVATSFIDTVDAKVESSFDSFYHTINY